MKKNTQNFVSIFSSFINTENCEILENDMLKNIYGGNEDADDDEEAEGRG